jgi:hypothetical protein
LTTDCERAQFATAKQLAPTTTPVAMRVRSNRDTSEPGEVGPPATACRNELGDRHRKTRCLHDPVAGRTIRLPSAWRGCGRPRDPATAARAIRLPLSARSDCYPGDPVAAVRAIQAAALLPDDRLTTAHGLTAPRLSHGPSAAVLILHPVACRRRHSPAWPTALVAALIVGPNGSPRPSELPPPDWAITSAGPAYVGLRAEPLPCTRRAIRLDAELGKSRLEPSCRRRLEPRESRILTIFGPNRRGSSSYRGRRTGASRAIWCAIGARPGQATGVLSRSGMSDERASFTSVLRSANAGVETSAVVGWLPSMVGADTQTTMRPAEAGGGT